MRVGEIPIKRFWFLGASLHWPGRSIVPRLLRFEQIVSATGNWIPQTGIRWKIAGARWGRFAVVIYADWKDLVDMGGSWSL